MKKKGFTLIELLIVIAIIGVLVGIVGGRFGCYGAPVGTYEDLAYDYAQRMRWSVDVISCLRYDSNADGYVTCDLNTCVRRDEETRQCVEAAVKQISCSVLQGGCKKNMWQ